MPGSLDALIADANDAISLLQMNSAGDSNDAEIAAGHDCASVLRQFVDYVTEHRPNVGGYTRGQVSMAANNAANLISSDHRIFRGESSESIRTNSFLDLMVHATVELLGNPDMSLDEIINAHWTLEDQECAVCGVPVGQIGDSTYVHADQEEDNAELDSDHNARPEPADATEMVIGWLTS